MARTLTITRTRNLQCAICKWNVELDYRIIGELRNGETRSFPIDEHSHNLRIVPLNALGGYAGGPGGIGPGTAMILEGNANCKATLTLGMGLLRSYVRVTCSYNAPSSEGSFEKGPMLTEHSNRVMSLANRYLKQRDSEAAEELENLLPVSRSFLSDPTTAEQELIMALQNTVLALRYVETPFNPPIAVEYAQTAETYFNAAMKRRDISKADYDSDKIWRDAMILIRGYCAYWNDDFQSALSLSYDLSADAVTLALSGSAMTRIAYEANPAYAYPAFKVLSEMDALLTENSRFDWSYKEDIIRAAYGFLTLLYDNAQEAFPDESRIPHSTSKALQLSRKVYVMLTVEKQKAWVMEDIIKYTNRL